MSKSCFQEAHVDICQKMFVQRLQAQEMGKDAGRFLFWMKICQSHGPMGVVVDVMGGGGMERNLPSLLPCLLNVHYALGLSQLPGVVTEMCAASENSKSNRVDKI